MFSSIGWFEVLLIALLALVIVGPEKLPGVIQDVRAAIFAARKAINNAKAELNGEFGELGKEFDSIRQPLSHAAEWGKLGPKGLITKALFDGDGKALDAFDPNVILGGHNAGNQSPENPGAQQYPGAAQYPTSYGPTEGGPGVPGTSQGAQGQTGAQGQPKQDYSGGGFSWADIT